MSTTLLALGLSFLLLWIFKQPRKTTQVVYLTVGILLITAYVLTYFLDRP